MQDYDKSDKECWWRWLWNFGVWRLGILTNDWDKRERARESIRWTMDEGPKLYETYLPIVEEYA